MNPTDREQINAIFATHLPHVKLVNTGAKTAGFEVLDEATHCDFCNASPVVRQFPARDIDLRLPPQSDGTPTVYRSHGDWGACAFCAECIDLDARDRLLKRAFDERVGAFDDITPPHLREQVRGQQRRTLSRSHAAFWKARL